MPKKIVRCKKKVEIYNILDILIYALSLKKDDNFKKFMLIKFWLDYILPTYYYNDNGNLKFAWTILCNKGLKAVFSLKSKILDLDFSDMKLKLKLFDSLIRPIISYASEIWLSDFTQKELKSENLPFEKIHNRFCKYLLGVHKKYSNFTSRCELGRLPILSFITSLTYK